jgi:hypothetical protein
MAVFKKRFIARGGENVVLLYNCECGSVSLPYGARVDLGYPDEPDEIVSYSVFHLPSASWFVDFLPAVVQLDELGPMLETWKGRGWTLGVDDSSDEHTHGRITA